MLTSYRYLATVLICAVLFSGCAGHNSQPILPDDQESPLILAESVSMPSEQDGSSHYLLAYNFIYIDPDNPDGPKIEVVPVREGELHLNILKMLEKGPCLNCFKLVGFNFPQPGYLDVDIQIDHPLDDLDFSVFDVRGIIMFQGSHTFPCAGKSISDPNLGDGAVLNPDGYTALFNGSTIGAPVGDFQKYFPGNIATPTVPDSDINGYMYFTTDTPLNDRNAFFAGSSDVRTFSLKLPTGAFVLGYAVDASYWLPTDSPVDDPLTDFDLNANCPEPWKIVVTEEPIGQGLNDQGGSTKLTIDVYDWQGEPPYKAPIVECPELFDSTVEGTWLEDGTGYSRYEATISNSKTAPVGDYLCLISAEANENDPVNAPWLDLTAYQIQTLTVSAKIPENPVAIGDADPNPQAVNFAVHFSGSDSYDPDGGPIIKYQWDWDNDGTWDHLGEFADHAWTSVGTYHVQLRVTDDENKTDLLDEPLEIEITEHQPPDACGDAEPLSTYICEPVHFFDCGSVAYDGATIDLQEWDWDNDDTFDEEGDDLYHTWNTPGTYFVQYRVTDSESFEDTLDDPLEIIVENALPVVIATASVYTADIWDPIDFDGTASHDTDCDDQAIMLWEWDFDYDDGEGFTVDDDSGPIVTWSYPSQGTYYVQLRVTDDEGETAMLDESLEIQVQYALLPPVAMAVSDKTAQLVGETVHFSDDGSYDPDGGLILEYEWDWENDGIFDDVGSEIDHSWGSPGTYYVQFRVTDDDSQTGLLDDPLEIIIADEPFYLMWAKQAGGSNEDSTFGIAALSDDSTVVTGQFNSSLTFGQDEPNETTLVSAGEYDIFVARYNPDGSLVWAKRAGGAYSMEAGYSVAAQSDDSVIVTGTFGGSATFGPGEGGETVLNSDGNDEIFIAKYNPDGTLTWAKRAGGEDDDRGYGITSLSDDSTVVAGVFQTSATFGAGELNETVLGGSTYFNVFVARYNSDGSLAWAKRAGSILHDYAFAIASLSDDSTVVTGAFQDVAIFGGSEPNQTILTSAGYSDVFVARYNVDGSLAWAKRAGGALSAKGFGITALSDDTTVVTGYFGASATFGQSEAHQTNLNSAGNADMFIARYNTNGTLEWAKRAGGTGGEEGYGITTLSDDTFVVTGYFGASATFGPGELNQTVLNTAGNVDIFVAQYNLNGSLAWATGAGGASSDYGRGVAALSDDTAIATGYFNASATFGPGEPFEATLISLGSTDIYMARYGADF